MQHEEIALRCIKIKKQNSTNSETVSNFINIYYASIYRAKLVFFLCICLLYSVYIAPLCALHKENNYPKNMRKTESFQGYIIYCCKIPDSYLTL